MKNGGIQMVDINGRWTEESDYSSYPKEKWCDYDYMAAWIRGQGYKPKTSMENLISMMFDHYECEIEMHVSEFDTVSGNFDGTYTEACQAFVEASGGIKEFDWEP